jgi:hypothetical protein
MYERLSPAVAFVETRNSKGDIGIGTCFHVGDSAWVTARHVVQDREVLSIGVTAPGGSQIARRWAGPYFHPEPAIDVAVLRIDDFDAPVIDLGGHLDDWFNDDFVMWRVLTMGYPPIPRVREPYLVSVTGEVNAIVERPHEVPHPHFIVSGTPRGGFSGGPVVTIAEGAEFALGLVTESLGTKSLPLELGFFAVLTVEPIYVCLGKHGLLPRKDRELFGDLFD